VVTAKRDASDEYLGIVGFTKFLNHTKEEAE